MEQYHYKFNQWEEAFKDFYHRHGGEKLYADDGEYLGFRQGDSTLCFIISRASEVSGYWIEPSSGAEPDDETEIYYTLADVKKLERRIRRQRSKTNALSLGGVIT